MCLMHLQRLNHCKHCRPHFGSHTSDPAHRQLAGRRARTAWARSGLAGWVSTDTANIPAFQCTRHTPPIFPAGH
ncbi:hypothetical protein C8Q80DRAFT_1196510 [Daedaleopsis nitida]|nr:hypothetical protein C8Q80DRAFT_1196510 [Daedaleopsis nitida]